MRVLLFGLVLDAKAAEDGLLMLLKILILVLKIHLNVSALVKQIEILE